METEFIVQRRRLRPADLAWLQQWIDEHPEWSRKRIARQLCQTWAWVDGRGRLKDFAARSLLLNLAARGQVQLPVLRVQYRSARPQVAALAHWQEPPAWSAALAAVAPVRLEPVQAGTPAARRWAFYLERFHYLGLRLQ